MQAWRKFMLEIKFESVCNSYFSPIPHFAYFTKTGREHMISMHGREKKKWWSNVFRNDGLVEIFSED